MKYKYVGEVEKVFPTLGVVVKPGDEFDAPAGFVAVGVIAAEPKPNSSHKHKIKDEEEVKEEIINQSAASDTTQGE